MEIPLIYCKKTQDDKRSKNEEEKDDVSTLGCTQIQGQLVLNIVYNNNKQIILHT